jgi:hypothetical protein
MRISTLRPGLLVSLKTSITGNVKYATREIEADHVADDGTRRATWETDRTILAPAEHEAAVKVRGKARSLVTGVCSSSSFGLLCPDSLGDKLLAAIRDARVLAEEFNATATVTQITVNAIIGRVAQDDVEAVRAINGEIRDLMTAMERGLRGLDVEAVRDAANKAKSLSAMLSPEASAKAERAIAVARSAARQIVKAGEAAAVEIDETVFRALHVSRAAFIDMEETTEAQEPEFTGRAVDFGDMAPPPVALPEIARPAFEMGE